MITTKPNKMKLINGTRNVFSDLAHHPYALTFLVFSMGVLPGATVPYFISHFSIPVSCLNLAGCTEPLTTKLLPAILIVILANKNSIIGGILSNPFRFGFYGGISYGIAQRIVYIFGGYGLSSPWIISIMLHGIWGISVAGTFFWSLGRDNRLPGHFVVVLGTIFAITTHTLWNVYVA